MNIIKKHYQQKAPYYGMPLSRMNKILELMGKNLKGKRVLDVGCSTGYFGREIEKYGAKVTGVDISEPAIKKAKKILSAAVTVDLNEQKLPFKSKSFDIVVASELIEHLFRPTIFIKDAHRVLKNDGNLIVTTPNLLYWANRLKFLLGNFNYEKEGVFDEGHIHFYTFKTLKEDLRESGFSISNMNNLYPARWVTSVRNLFPGLFAYQFVIEAKKKV